MVKAGRFDPDSTRSGRFPVAAPAEQQSLNIASSTSKNKAEVFALNDGAEAGGVGVDLEDGFSTVSASARRCTDEDKESSVAETEGSGAFPFTESDRWAGDVTDTDSSSDAGSLDGDKIGDSTTLAELWELIRPSLRPKMVQVHPSLQKFVHKLSLVVHLKHADSSRFLCGRLASARYEKHTSGTSVGMPAMYYVLS